MNTAPAAESFAERARRWLRFVVVGLSNTAFSYGLYWMLEKVLTYQLAYLLAYMAGIGFSYVSNALWVFRTTLSWRTFMLYPGVYVVQYLASALTLAGLVELAGVDPTWAPLAVTAAMVPLTYLLSRTALLNRAAADSLTR